MTNSILLYDLAYKSKEACAELWKAEYFRPENGEFKRGTSTIEAKVLEKGIYYETKQNGNIVGTLYINRKGVCSPCRF
jgi:hypothetical protein